jgi:hypothetical protein
MMSERRGGLRGGKVHTGRPSMQAQRGLGNVSIMTDAGIACTHLFTKSCRAGAKEASRRRSREKTPRSSATAAEGRPDAAAVRGGVGRTGVYGSCGATEQSTNRSSKPLFMGTGVARTFLADLEELDLHLRARGAALQWLPPADQRQEGQPQAPHVPTALGVPALCFSRKRNVIISFEAGFIQQNQPPAMYVTSSITLHKLEPHALSAPQSSGGQYRAVPTATTASASTALSSSKECTATVSPKSASFAKRSAVSSTLPGLTSWCRNPRWWRWWRPCVLSLCQGCDVIDRWSVSQGTASIERVVKESYKLPTHGP